MKLEDEKDLSFEMLEENEQLKNKFVQDVKSNLANTYKVTVDQVLIRDIEKGKI
jgi:hypothetical protein